MKQVILVVFLITSVFLVGCSDNQLTGEKPPNVFIKIGNEKYETKLGTYCWPNGTTTTCVDTAGPVELLKDKVPINANPGEKITFIMEYELKPTNVEVIQIHENKESTVAVKENTIIAPMEKGIYYYSYGVWWMDEKQENVSNGDAFYAFVIEVN